MPVLQKMWWEFCIHMMQRIAQLYSSHYICHLEFGLHYGWCRFTYVLCQVECRHVLQQGVKLTTCKCFLWNKISINVLFHSKITLQGKYNTCKERQQAAKSIQQISYKKLTVPKLDGIPCILWDLKFHWCLHNNPPLVHILSQKNPVHVLLSNFFKIYCNVIVLYIFTSSNWSLSFWFALLIILHMFPFSPLCAIWLTTLSPLIWLPECLVRSTNHELYSSFSVFHTVV